MNKGEINMKRVAKFEKVSYAQFKKDWLDTFSNKYNDWDEDAIDRIVKDIYDSIKLPTRSTTGSAGHDFHCPYNFMIPVNESIKIPTGIKCYMEEGWVLQCYPRSSHGFKYGLHLANGVGIVDQDYYNNASNEGHIFIKIVNDSVLAKTIELETGSAFCQGLFIPFGVTYDDNVNDMRSGGIGSTGK
jgi:dUTP pyrophosphatase